MKDKTVRKLVFAALFAALSCVATMVIKIPTPIGGYIHVGDAVVLLAGFLLGPWWGAAAAGLGSGLADLIAGYGLYVPGTFIIKFVVALIGGSLLRSAFIKNKTVRAFAAGIIGEIVMVLGYLAYEAFLLGYGAAGFFDDLRKSCAKHSFFYSVQKSHGHFCLSDQRFSKYLFLLRAR